MIFFTDKENPEYNEQNQGVTLCQPTSDKAQLIRYLRERLDWLKRTEFNGGDVEEHMLPAFERVADAINQHKLNANKTIIYLLTDSCAHFHNLH